MRLAVVGGGAWGSALAQTFALGGHDVRLAVRDQDNAALIAGTRRSERMPGLLLDRRVAVTADHGAALLGAEVVLLAVPTHAMRTTAARCRPHWPPGAVAVSAAKGFELGTRLRMTEVLAEALPAGVPVLAMSGPNIAPEVAAGLPAAAVVACNDAAVAADVRDRLGGTLLRFYSSSDVVGVEYCGALKNVVAIAAGMVDGLRLGDNAKAAVITRAIAEMARLGAGAGAQPVTFAGLAGLGDCMVTCFSPHSRNRRVGEAIARGQSLAEASADLTAEGVGTARVAQELGRAAGEETPIVDQVCGVLFAGKPLSEAIVELMRRDPRDEMNAARIDPLHSAVASDGE